MKTKAYLLLSLSVSCAISALLPFALRADTVTLAPPAGTTTNVLTLYTGDTAVEIAGPGTVRLNNSNSHTGGTTLSGGTLEISGNIPGGSRSPVGAGTFTVGGGTLLGSGTFGGDITVTNTTSIEAPDGWTLSGNNAFSKRVNLSAGTLTISGGSVTLSDNHFQLSPTNNANTTFAMTGGAFNANGKRIITGFQTTYATNVTDISGTAAVTNSEYCYVYEGAGNYWALNVHDGGLFATKGSPYAAKNTALHISASNGGRLTAGSDIYGMADATLSISVSNGGEVIAKKLYASSRGTLSVDVSDGGVLGFTDLATYGSGTLAINGGILRNDGAPSGDNNYFKWIQDSSTLSVSVGPGGATFKGGGKTTKFAQIYQEMRADAGDGSAPKGVVFDGGNWAYYTAQSYAGPTVIKNGAGLFIAKAGYFPANSDVTVEAGGMLRNGSAEKSVRSLTLGEGATLGFADTTSILSVTDSIVLPNSAKIALYAVNTPNTNPKNTNGTYDLLTVPAAFADALRAVRWSCATAVSGKVYSFSVSTSGATATLSMTIANASGTIGGSEGADSSIVVGDGEYVFQSGDMYVGAGSVTMNGGVMKVDGNIYSYGANGTITLNGGLLDASNVRLSSGSGVRTDLYLNEGAVLRARQMTVTEANTVEHVFHYNGGTLCPVASGDNYKYFPRFQSGVIGEKGVIIDLSDVRLDGTTGWYRFSCQSRFDHDDTGPATDGGITIRGIPGETVLFHFGGGVANSTFNGDVVAEAGGAFMLGNQSFAGKTLRMLPKSFFKQYDNTTAGAVGTLVIGEENATDAVSIQVAASGPPALVVEDFSVLSPVEFSVYQGNNWTTAAAPASGTYTALVYRVVSQALDASLLRLPAGASGTISASTVALTSGDYAGYTALVVTIENDIVVTGATEYPTPLAVSSDRTCGSIVVGGAWNGVDDPVCDSSLTISGNVTASDGLYLGYDPAPGTGPENPHQGFLTLNGGSITTPALYSIYRPSSSSGNSECRFGCEATVNGGLLDIAGDIRFGVNRSMYGDKLYSRLIVNGGRVIIGGKFYLLYYNATSQSSNGENRFSTPGSIVLNDGEIDVTGVIDLGRNSHNKSLDDCTSYRDRFGIWLNGGVLKAENITMTAPLAVPKVYFNGGVYKPYGAAAANRTMQNLNKCYVSTNGAVVSTENLPANATYTIAQPLLTDPALSGDTDGGLTKRGAGTLALSGANTFTGITKVEEGTLVASTADALSADAAVSDGAILDLGNADVTIATAAASGAIQNGNLSVADAIVLAGDGSVLSVDGDLTLNSSTAIDFGLAEGETPSSDWIPVAAVSGTLSAPISLRVRNCGDFNRCDTQIIDGVLYVKATTAGFTLIIR